MTSTNSLKAAGIRRRAPRRERSPSPPRAARRSVEPLLRPRIVHTTGLDDTKEAAIGAGCETVYSFLTAHAITNGPTLTLSSPTRRTTTSPYCRSRERSRSCRAGTQRWAERRESQSRQAHPRAANGDRAEGSYGKVATARRLRRSGGFPPTDASGSISQGDYSTRPTPLQALPAATHHAPSQSMASRLGP